MPRTWTSEVALASGGVALSVGAGAPAAGEDSGDDTPARGARAPRGLRRFMKRAQSVFEADDSGDEESGEEAMAQPAAAPAAAASSLMAIADDDARRFSLTHNPLAA